MEAYLEPARSVPVAFEADVAVVGGGVSGLSAALAASRNGARTILIERLGFMGGVASATLMTSFTNWTAGRTVQVVGGIGLEMVHRLEEAGYATSTRLEREGGSPGYRINTEYFRYLADVMLAESGATSLLHSVACAPMMDGNRVCGVIVENKSGRQAISAKVVVDCSGDADIAARAGAPFEFGRPSDGKVWPLSNMPRVTNYDADKLQAFLKDHPTDRALMTEVAEARARGEFNIRLRRCIPRRVDGAVNSIRVYDINPTDAWDMTKAEIESRRQLYADIIPFLRKYAPGCENVQVSALGTQISPRESRRIIGDYVINEYDVLLAHKHADKVACYVSYMDLGSNPDGVATDMLSYLPLRPEEYAEFAHTHVSEGGGAVQIRPTEKGIYDIPYRALVPKQVDGVLVAGKNISCTHTAIPSLRYLPAGMATGEAAGTAAALAAKAGVAPRDVNVPALQQTLEAQGAILNPGQ